MDTEITRMENPNEKTVRLTLSSRHILPDPAIAERMASLFEQNGITGDPDDDWDETDPECFPDEMSDALAEISYMEGIPIPGEDSSPLEDGDFPEESDTPSPKDRIMEELRARFDELMEKLEDCTAEKAEEAEDENAFIFDTEARMIRERQPDGSDTLEISYEENDSLDRTISTILLNTGCPGLVTIYRSGDVISTLICEEKRRHISAYETPVGVFEMAVYTKSCTGSITFENGGTLSLDYIVELRGMDVQRTKMTITVGEAGETRLS